MTVFDIDSIIGNIYDAVTAPDGFQQFIDRLAAAFDLKAAMLFTHNVLSGESKGMWQCGMERQWIESYALEYGRDDLLARHLATSSIATFYASNLHLAAVEHKNSRFYREWIVPQGVGFAAGAVILQEGVWATQVVLQRSPIHSPFTQVELDALDRLIAHLQRSVQMRHRFLELQLGQTVLTAGLDILAIPSIMVDEWGLVVHANRAAHILMDQRNAIWIEDRHLCTSTLASTKQIGMEVIVAISASRGSDSTVPGIVVVPRPDNVPLTATVFPMRAAESGLKGAAVLFVHDPSDMPGAKPDLLKRLFSLSTAEAELVVALCKGQTVDEAARTRRTSVHTVRTQLKSIFGKTGTRRQTDLVALVLSSPAYFVASH